MVMKIAELWSQNGHAKAKTLPYSKRGAKKKKKSVIFRQQSDTYAKVTCKHMTLLLVDIAEYCPGNPNHLFKKRLWGE